MSIMSNQIENKEIKIISKKKKKVEKYNKFNEKLPGEAPHQI